MKTEWDIADKLVPYEQALATMDSHVNSIIMSGAPDRVWLLEHPPLYTAGTSAKAADMLNPRFPVYDVGRGGQYTYHGPGQRVGYVMMDLARKNKKDVRKFVFDLEQWLINSLAEFNIHAERRAGRVGLWVATEGTEKKIAAIGIRLRKWVSFHGVSINLEPDLEHFSGIVPCGIRTFGVTSLHDMGQFITMVELDMALRHHFERVFAP